VVLGHCGSGKSFLFNNLCGAKQDTGISPGSKTRDITYQEIKYMPKFFRMYDTPGTDSK
jgi:predicted GTPase